MLIINVVMTLLLVWIKNLKLVKKKKLGGGVIVLKKKKKSSLGGFISAHCILYIFGFGFA